MKKERKFWQQFKAFWTRGYYETKLSFKTETKRQMLKSLFWMVVGNVILAYGTAVFIIPNSLITGGVSGIGLIVSGALKSVGITVDTELIIMILTWVLFVVGLLLLGLRFSVKTLIATAIYPPLLYLFKLMVVEFPWLSLEVSQMATLLGGLFGGVFVGVGVGCTFIGGGSTGGVDCLSLAADKYLHIKTSVASFFIDGAIILIGFLVNRDLENTLIGIVSAIMAAIMIDRVFLGQSTSFIAWIVTERFDQLSDRINNELERGTTLFLAEGGYTANSYKVVEVVFDRKEYRDLQNIIADIDPTAFVTTVRAHEVAGDGFKKTSYRRRLSIEELKEKDAASNRYKKEEITRVDPDHKEDE